MGTFHEKKITTQTVKGMKKKGQKISMLTAYDATFARLIDEMGIDIILIGDSLGTVIHGHKDTLGVSVDDVVYHTKAVCRGTKRAHIVADMPFMSYQASVSDAIANAGKLIKDGGAEAVKLEGGLELVDTVKALTAVGIPVMAHIGLKPQSINQMGGYKIQGRSVSQVERLLDEARAMENAGAYSLLLEGITMEAAAEITKAVSIPTIGISSGPSCDGQVLVIYDLLGMNEEFSPKYLKKYVNLSKTIKGAVSEYIADVKNGRFPTSTHGFSREKRN